MQKDKEQSKWCIVAFILHYRNAQSCPSVIYTASTLLLEDGIYSWAQCSEP